MSIQAASDGGKAEDLAWLKSLGIALPLQIIASFVTQIVIVLGPVIAATAGIGATAVGTIAACVSAGTVIFLIFGMPFLKRFGAFSFVLVGLVTCVAALGIASIAWWPAVMVAALLLGIGYGPVPPSGSKILAKSAPARHRSLIFSIKQAGAPFGTALAGLAMPPLAAACGWQASLWIAGAATLIFSMFLLPFRVSINGGDEADKAVALRASFNRSLLTRPVTLLVTRPELRVVTILAIGMALAQGVVFANFIIFLSKSGFDLVSASMGYAACQFGGFAARLIVGWVADRLGSATKALRIQAVLAACTIAAFGLFASALPFAAVMILAGLLGFLVASWNGLYLAEVARIVPLAEVSEATAAATVVLFGTYAVGPSLFALLLTAIGQWEVVWSCFSIVLLLVVISARFVTKFDKQTSQAFE